MKENKETTQQKRPTEVERSRKQLWSRVMKAWDSNLCASFFELASRYTRKYPDKVCGWVALADVLTDLARYDDAAKALLRAQRFGIPGWKASICRQWGHLEDQRGNLRAAERWYSQAAKLKPTTLTLVFLGGVLAKQGRYRDSKRCHRRAIRLATHNPDEAYLNLGLILRAERKYERAIECFERAIQLDPKYETAKIARRDIREVLKLKRQLKKL